MRLKQTLIALDQVINALAGGWADETISARAYRSQHLSRGWHWVRVIVDAVFFWDEQHCRDSYLSECGRQQLPPEYRQPGAENV